nr:transmembrane protein 233-like isoform X2 [Microcebus murinus]
MKLTGAGLCWSRCCLPEAYSRSPLGPAGLVRPPMVSLPLPVDPPVEDFLPLSIVSLLCCFPFGILALIFSIRTQDGNTCGDRTRAERNSSMALAMGMASVVLGLLFIFFTSSIQLAW